MNLSNHDITNIPLSAKLTLLREFTSMGLPHLVDFIDKNPDVVNGLELTEFLQVYKIRPDVIEKARDLINEDFIEMVSTVFYQNPELFHKIVKNFSIPKSIFNHKRKFTRLAVDNLDLKQMLIMEELDPYWSKMGVIINEGTNVRDLEFLNVSIDNEVESFDHLCELVFGTVSKSIRKRMLSLIFKNGENNPNTRIVNFLTITKSVIKEYKMPDKLKNISEDDFTRKEYSYDKKWRYFESIYTLYGEERTLKLMNSVVDDTDLKDTHDMLNELDTRLSFISDPALREKWSRKNLKKELGKKPKSVKEIHDNIARLLSKLGQENLMLGTAPISHLEGLEYKDMKLRVPTDAHELIDVGTRLDICVGNGTYAKKSHRGESYILTVMDKNGYKYCIEIMGSKIIQAQGRGGVHMDDQKLKDFIIENLINPKRR